MGSSRIARLIALVSLVAAGSARAQVAAESESGQMAKALHVEGTQLRDAGNLEAALTKFKAAHALVKTPITGLSVGTTLEKLGRLVEARAVLLETAKVADYAGMTPTAVRARAEAEEAALRLKPRIPSVRIKIAGLTGSERADVSIDREPIAAAALDEPVPLDPGKHTLRARSGAREVDANVVLAEGENKDLTLALPAPPLPAPSPDPRPVPAPAPRPRGWPALTWIGVSVALAGVAVGTVSGVVVLGKKPELERRCGSNGECPRDAFDLLDSTNTWGGVSTVSFVLAGVGVLVGLGALALRPSGAAVNSVYLTPSGVGGSF